MAILVAVINFLLDVLKEIMVGVAVPLIITLVMKKKKNHDAHDSNNGSSSDNE